MKQMKRKLSCLSLAALLLVSCAACGGGEGKESGSPDADSAGRTTLNYRIPDSFATLDPHSWNLDSDFRMCYQIYEPLYEIANDGSEVPILATGYDMSSDGLTCTFTLRDDVVFSNGDAMTASDVKYSIERAKASSYVSTNVATVDSVDANDDARTVTLHMSAPTPGLIQGLNNVLVVSQKFTEENMDENGLLGFKTCGTGPYVLKEYTSDVSVTLEARSDYRSGEAAIKTLNFYLIPDENTALTAFQAGELDAATLNTSSWSSLKSSDTFQTAELPTNHVTYLIMNTKQAPFDNELVRQAVACAVNREDIIAMSMDGMAAPTYTVATPFMVGYPEIEPKFTFDQQRAKDLLTQAGYPDGLDIGEIQALSGTYFVDVVEVVQQQLAEVGITATISGLEANTLINNCMTDSFGMADMGQSNTFDMVWTDTYYTSANIGSMNMAQVSDPELDARFAEAGACMDPDQRVALYKGILEDVDEACYYVPLFNKTKCFAWAKDLNYTPTIRTERFYDCSWN